MSKTKPKDFVITKSSKPHIKHEVRYVHSPKKFIDWLILIYDSQHEKSN